MWKWPWLLITITLWLLHFISIAVVRRDKTTTVSKYSCTDPAPLTCHWLPWVPHFMWSESMLFSPVVTAGSDKHVCKKNDKQKIIKRKFKSLTLVTQASLCLYLLKLPKISPKNSPQINTSKLYVREAEICAAMWTFPTETNLLSINPSLGPNPGHSWLIISSWL